MIYAIDLFHQARSTRTKTNLLENHYLQTYVDGLVEVQVLYRRCTGMWAQVRSQSGEVYELSIQGWYQILEGRDDVPPPAPHDFTRHRRF